MGYKKEQEEWRKENGKQRQLGYLTLASCLSMESLEFPFSLSDIFYSNLWQSLLETLPTMSSVWFTNVLLIQVNKVSECDFSHSTFSIFSSWSLAEILSQHSLNCDRKESRWCLCSSQALGAGEGLRVENTSREKRGKGRGDRVFQGKLCLSSIVPGDDYVLR